MSNPRVTVLMAVYNSERYLREAVESVLNQSFHDFEFLIIDDGSTDGSPSILAEYAALEPRIVLESNQSNIGHANSLNRGLKLARGEYIARMDSDDISLPNRLLRQVTFMDLHPRIGICGTCVRNFGARSNNWYLPQDDAEIRTHMFFHSPFAHPTVMIRKQILIDHSLTYEQEYDPAEDYELWCNAAEFTSFANLPEILFLYRKHNEQLTSRRWTAMRSAGDRVRLNQLTRLGIEVTDETADLHLKMIKLEGPVTEEFLAKADLWLQKLRSANQLTHVFPEPNFSVRLGWQWYAICSMAVHLGVFSWNSFWLSPLSHLVKLKLHTKLRFRLFCSYPWLQNIEHKLRKPHQ